MLCMYVNKDHDNWDELLSSVVFAYNNAIHSTTGYAPNQMVFSKLLPSANDRKLDTEPPENNKSSDQVSKEIAEKIEQAHFKQESTTVKIIYIINNSKIN